MEHESTVNPAVQVTAPKKSLKQMTPEERRDYNKIQKRNQRARDEKKRLASEIPVALDYRLPQAQRDQLKENSRQMIKTIESELSERLTEQDHDTVRMISEILTADAQHFVKQVCSPDGFLYGHYFVDAGASEAIFYVHRFPKLLESPTFNNLYQQFLKLVKKLSRHEWFEPRYLMDVDAELNGTYTLPPEPEIPKAPEPAPPTPPQPHLSDREVLEQGRVRLLEQLQPLLPREARNYLYGN